MPNSNVNTTSLSVIMPAYNEEGSIMAAVEDVEIHILKKFRIQSLLLLMMVRETVQV